MKKRDGKSIDWPAIRNEFVTGHISFKELGEKHNIKDATVRQRANRENWSHLRNELTQAVTNSVMKTATQEKIDILNKWNKETIEEARLLRMAARSLFMEKTEDGRFKIKHNLTGSELNAASAANTVADRLVRLSVGSETELSTSSGGSSLPVSVDEFL